MELTKEKIYGINVALNEADLLGIQFDKERGIAITFSPLAIDEKGDVPSERRVSFWFGTVGRFAASYRLGRWDDKNAEVLKFAPEQILEKVEEFGKLPIYGWEFIDSEKFDFNSWSDRLSFDWRSEKPEGMKHTIDLFQEGNGKHIDIRIWFDDFVLYSPDHKPISLDDFIASGKRAWDGIYSDPNIGKKFAVQVGPIPYTNMKEGDKGFAGTKIFKTDTDNTSEGDQLPQEHTVRKN